MKTNNSGGGFGKPQRCLVVLHSTLLSTAYKVVATVLQLGTWTCCLCAQPDMNLKTLQVCCAPLINMPRMHCCHKQGAVTSQFPKAVGPAHAGSSCWNGLQMADGTCMPLPLWAIRSGPRKQIYYNPKEVQCPTPQASPPQAPAKGRSHHGGAYIDTSVKISYLQCFVLAQPASRCECTGHIQNQHSFPE